MTHECATPATGARRSACGWVPALVVFALGIVAWQWLLPLLGVERFLLPPLSDVLQASLGRADGARARPGGSRSRRRSAGSSSAARSRSSSRSCLARWRPLRQRADAVHDRGERDADHRVRPDHERLVRDALARGRRSSIAAVLCFFPVLVNTLRGLTSVRPESLELMRSYAAPPARGLPARAHPEQPALRLRGLEDRVRTRDDRRCRGRLLRRIDRRARRRRSSRRCRVAQYETAWAAILVASVLGIAFYAVDLARRAATRSVGIHRSRTGVEWTPREERHEETKVVRRGRGAARGRCGRGQALAPGQASEPRARG